jgi:hypothetical protein
MHITPDTLVALLHAQQFQANTVLQISLTSGGPNAFACAIDSRQALSIWRFFHTYLAQMAYYPVITLDWGGTQDFFSRYDYQNEYATSLISDTAPDSLRAAASSIDRVTYLRHVERKEAHHVADALERACQQTLSQFGACPSRATMTALIERGEIQSIVDLERYLFTWERQTFGDDRALRVTDTAYVDWFITDHLPTYLLILPTRAGWDTLAHLHWYGAYGCGGTPTVIHFLRHWFHTYRAELVCNYDTMLQFVVEEPPRTPEAAFQLAWEQIALAPCTTLLPGVSLRDHARTLLTNPRWHLHERP